MSANQQVADAALAWQAAIVAEIATTAQSLQRVLTAAVQAGDDFVTAGALIEAARHTANYIGALADAAAGRLGTRQVRGGADEWLDLPGMCERADA